MTGAVAAMLVADLVPDSVNWGNLSSSVEFALSPATASNSTQTMSGFSVVLPLTISWTGAGATFTYTKNGSASSISNGGSFTVIPGDTLYFTGSRSASGTSSGTVTVTNGFTGDVIDTFTYSLTVGLP